MAGRTAETIIEIEMPERGIEIVAPEQAHHPPAEPKAFGVGGGASQELLGFREFVDRCRQAFDAGQRSKHHIFPSVVRVAGVRALAETNIVILVRQKINGVLADMTSYARFLDRLERRDGRWVILERTAIYERDRLDPVEPSEAFDKLFKASDLSVYPEAYRYMAARLTAAGRALAPVVYRDGSPHTAQLYARYDCWLAGK